MPTKTNTKQFKRAIFAAFAGLFSVIALMILIPAASAMLGLIPPYDPEVSEITDPDGESSADFGYDVDIDGDYAIVGARWDDGGNGSVLIFYNDPADFPDLGWVEQIKILGEGAGYNFGQAVAIDAANGRAIMNASQPSISSGGKVYIHEKDYPTVDAWGLRKTITSTSTDSSFGMAVDIDGDYAIVGYYRFSSNTGRAYIHKKDTGGINNWGIYKTLSGNGAINDLFGVMVAIDGNNIVVGESDYSTGRGRMHIYSKDDFCADCWGSVGATGTPMFTATGSGDYGRLGQFVDISGDYVMSGQGPFFTDFQVLIYRLDTGVWALDEAIFRDDYQFGNNSMSIYEHPSGIVSAVMGINDSLGLYFLYERDPGGIWTEQLELSPFSIGDGNSTLSISEEYIIAGNKSGSINGRAFISKYMHAICNNAIIEAPLETCEDGNLIDGDSCSSTCYDEICGDNVVVPLEECDDGNTDNGDGCSATCQLEIQKLVASDAAASDRFGAAVDISGSYAIVGTYNGMGMPANAAYIFEKNEGTGEWTEVAILTATGGGMMDNFGGSVAISGDYAIVGTNNSMSAANKAYIFAKGAGWADMTQTATLTATDSAFNDNFGGSVSISGDYAIVGTNSNTGGGNKAYIFAKGAGWADMTQTAILTATGGTSFDNFGAAVAISGDFAIVGTNSGMSAANKAYIFAKGAGWTDMTQTAILTPTGGGMMDNFGASVSISGDYAIVGTNNSMSPGNKAYIFAKGAGWADMTQTATLIGTGVSGSDNFGASVSIAGTYAIVGTYDSMSMGGGDVAYIFEKDEGGADTWGQLAEIVSFDLTPNDQFGAAVAIDSDGEAIAGAPSDDDGGMDSGSAYIYEEREDVAGGGGGGSPICFAPTPKAYDLPLTLPVQVTDGKPSVLLNWSDGNINTSLITEILRDGKNIKALAGTVTSFADTTVEANICNPLVVGSCRLKEYKYTLRTRNACDDTRKGSEAVAYINPIVPAGVEIDVTADISLIVKEGFNTLFQNKLEELSNLNETQADAPVVDDKVCTSAKNAYFATSRTRTDRTLATEYITACFGNLIDSDINQIVEPMLISQLSSEELEALIEAKVAKLTQAQDQVSTYFVGINQINPTISFTEFKSAEDTSERDSLLCGGTALNECTQNDRDAVEAYFEGSSQATGIVVEVTDKDGNEVIQPIHTRTDIFGQVKDLDLGTFISGDTYKVKITLVDRQYVLPKTLTVTLNNPVPATVDDITTFSSHLNLNLDEQFCFGDFDGDGNIDLNDILALKDLVQSGGDQIFDLWEAINLDGIAGFDLLDMLTLLKNFQCEAG